MTLHLAGLYHLRLNAPQPVPAQTALQRSYLAVAVALRVMGHQARHQLPRAHQRLGFQPILDQRHVGLELIGPCPFAGARPGFAAARLAGVPQRLQISQKHLQ